MNPYEIDNANGYYNDHDDEVIVKCHSCDGLLNDDPAEYRIFGGWHYCVDCHAAITIAPAVPDRMDQVRR